MTLASGGGVSTSRRGGGAIFCRANIVADCGGVFSPRILCWVLRVTQGRTAGLRLMGIGVGVVGRGCSFSAGLDSFSGSRSRFRCGVLGLECFSGDPLGVGLIESPRAPSIMRLRSRTVLPGPRDCIRLWWFGLVTRARSDCWWFCWWFCWFC